MCVWGGVGLCIFFIYFLTREIMNFALSGWKESSHNLNLMFYFLSTQIEIYPVFSSFFLRVISLQDMGSYGSSHSPVFCFFQFKNTFSFMNPFFLWVCVPPSICTNLSSKFSSSCFWCALWVLNTPSHFSSLYVPNIPILFLIVMSSFFLVFILLRMCIFVAWSVHVILNIAGRTESYPPHFSFVIKLSHFHCYIGG